MEILLIILFFTGLLMIMYGLYENKINLLKKSKFIEYKFVPRTYYDEQIYNIDFNKKIKNIYHFLTQHN